MIKKLFKLCITLIFSFLLFSCSKDEDSIVPQIIINEPYELMNFNVLDTVKIRANIYDDKNIKSVEIEIVNTDYLPISNKYSYQPNNKDFFIYEEIALDNIQLKSGTYYLKIRAFDGFNEKHLYRAIIISGVQRKFKSIITINKNNETSFTIYAIDSSQKQLFTYDRAYNFSAINHDFQQLYICGRVNGKLNAYNLIDNSLAWEIEADNNPPTPSFENLYFKNNILYLSGYLSYITGFNRFSNIMYSSATTTNYFPVKTLKTNNYLIAEKKSKTSDLRLLSIYYTPTGYLKNSTYLSFSINSMFEKDNDEIIVFGNNQQNQSVLYWFNTENQTFYSPHSISSEQLNDVARIDQFNFLILTTSKIYWYQIQSNSLTPLISNINANHIDFEDISQTIILSSNNKLLFYNFPFASKTNEISMQTEIINFHLNYNKTKE